jgi:hypothetical protein
MSRPTSYELLATALAEVVQDAVAEALPAWQARRTQRRPL